MSDELGLTRHTLYYTALFGAILLLISIVYGVAMLPAIIGINSILPEFSGYTFYAGIGWIIAYAALTLKLIRINGLEKLKNFNEQLDTFVKIIALVFATAYINVVVLLSTAIGMILIPLAGFPTIGFIALILYPGLDLQYAPKVPTPGRLALHLILGVFHAVGVLQELTADSVVRGISQPVAS